MGSDFWEEFIGLPEEISEEEANKLEKDALVIDLEGEVCPYPQIKTKEAFKTYDIWNVKTINESTATDKSFLIL